MGIRLKLTLGLVVLLGVGYAAATWTANQRTAAAVVEHTAQALGVTTTLERASVGLATGSVSLSGLEAENPTGFDAPRLVLVPRIEGRVRSTTLLRPVVEVSRLTLTGLELHLERRSGVGNYSLILDHYLREGRHAGDPDRRYLIETLAVSDAVVYLDLLPELGETGRLRVPIHELRLVEVGGGEGGLMLQEVVGVVVRSVLQAVLDRAAEELPAAILRELREQVDELLPPGADLSSGGWKGPLHGTPTTWGSSGFQNDEDAEVVVRLREAGAVLVAKLVTGEFAPGGPLRDPVKEGRAYRSLSSRASRSTCMVPRAAVTATSRISSRSVSSPTS